MNRNKRKAIALTTISEGILAAATLTAGLAGFYLITDIAQWLGVVLAIALAFGAHTAVAPILTTTFGPTIDRLNGVTPTTVQDDQEKETVR